jgi:hypothetical protein
MTEEEARRFLLVRAVESEDAEAALLTREDREQARDAGLSASARDADDAFLTARAGFAYARLRTRYPQVERAEAAARWPSWVNWALPLAALAIGLFFNELSGGNRLNIIAFPLLGTLAWNLLLYVILLAAWLGRLRRRDAPPARTWLERLVGSGSAAGGGGHPLLSRAFARFGTDWLRHGGPLTHARVRRNLHLSAAALAVGILIGMYWRALSVEYRAGWESTFVGPATLHGLLQAVLGPASAVTGIGLPSPDRLTALRWSEGNGEIAGPWIHLWAATATLFIIGPRLVLAALSALRAWRLRRRLPVPGREDFYVRRLLREARGPTPMPARRRWCAPCSARTSARCATPPTSPTSRPAI